jgi:TonB family protein
MREEHYRRIAYANQNFSSAIVPGWKTDRGMIYIKFGPPDEKEGHPEANPPSELWLYRFITGIGTNVRIEFVDESRTGEYHMTKDPSAAAAPEKPLSVAQFVAPGGRGGTFSVRAQAAGTFVAIHVAEGQFVTRGQILVDLQSNDPAHNRIASPVEGFVKDLSAAPGSHIDAGQQLLTIVPRDQTPKETPISYFEAEMKSLQYQAGFESAYILTKNPTFDFNDPAVKPLSDASRELSRTAQERSSDAQAALERLRIAVENARAARLGAAAPNNSKTQAPWWAPDPQNAAAMAQAIEVTAWVNTDGTAHEVTVVRSSNASLNQSAIDAVQSWHFPTLRGGQEVYEIRVLIDPSKLARR